jgi:hypothetical protein
MTRILWVSLLALFTLAGCAPVDPEAFQEPTEPTAEQARNALIQLIRTNGAGEFRDFPVQKYINDQIEGDGDSRYWAGFCLNLKDRSYTFSERVGTDTSFCDTQYVGSFEWQSDKWVALPPKRKFVACTR